MKKPAALILITAVTVSLAPAEELDLFIIAGQSNAQGWQGNATLYPKDEKHLDQTIPFYWVTPGQSSSDGQWTTLKAQGGRFETGHFGLEVTFARSLKEAGYEPAIFKYSLGSTSLAGNWQGPGDGKMYDQMAKEFQKALLLLREAEHTVTICGLIWIQGESDAQTPAMAEAYQGRLKTLIVDMRDNVTGNEMLSVILGVDEQHPWVKTNPQVVLAQKILAEADKQIVFTSMVGLEKADSTHLTPKGLQDHGKLIFAAYEELNGDSQAKPKRKE